MKRSGRGRAGVERRHARKRALERYGLEVGDASRNEIIRQIQSNESEHIESRTNRTSVHRVSVEGVTAVVVYDKLRKELVTFLPSNYR